MNTLTYRLIFGTLVALVIAIFALVLPTPLSTFALPPNGADVVVGTTTDAYSGVNCSLRDAIQTVNNSTAHGGCARVFNGTPFNVILVPGGVYTLTIAGANEDFDATGDLDIRKSMIISATGATSPTITANPGWQDRIFHVISGTVTLQGLVISGGYTGNMGGGVAMEMFTSVTMQNDRVTKNTSFDGGGGISNWYGTLTLKNVQIDGNTFYGNTSIYGGAGLFSYGGTNHLTSVIITNNQGVNGLGGGTYTAGVIGTTDFTDVTISNNTANGAGGMLVDGAVTLTNVSLVGNSGGSGGGMMQYGGTLTIINSTFSGNSAYYFGGGGIYQDSGDARLINVTMNNNSATPGQGGAIYFFNKGTMVLTNTIVANSPATGNCNTAIGGNFNLSSDNSCGFGVGRETLNVMLGPLGYHGGSTLTHLLLLGSPAINFGTNSGCPSTDQRGLPRPIGSACDVGAVELQPSELVLHLYLPLILK